MATHTLRPLGIPWSPLLDFSYSPQSFVDEPFFHCQVSLLGTMWPETLADYAQLFLQARKNDDDFEHCITYCCLHCLRCIECNARRELRWTNEPALRERMSERNNGLRIRAELLERVAPDYVRDYAVYEQLLYLQDQLAGLEKKVVLLSQHLGPEVTARVLRDANQRATASNPVKSSEEPVRKQEAVEEYTAITAPPFQPHTCDIAMQMESEEDDYETAASSCDDTDDEIIVKRAQTPQQSTRSIHHIPAVKQEKIFHPQVVIPLEEQLAAKQFIRNQKRRQPHRDATLKIPRPSIEGKGKKAGGAAWTEYEDRKVRKGFKKNMSKHEIQEKYLPHRSAEAIRKRKRKLGA